MNAGSSCPNRSVLSIILPSAVKVPGPGSGNLKKEEAMSLTPHGRCMWVAPSLQALNLLLQYGEGADWARKTWLRRVLLEGTEHIGRLKLRTDGHKG